jgi:hypothetical protein
VLFSGDAFNPSAMSTITKGKHMVPVLNDLGTHVACMGNHGALPTGLSRSRSRDREIARLTASPPPRALSQSPSLTSRPPPQTSTLASTTTSSS